MLWISLFGLFYLEISICVFLHLCRVSSFSPLDSVDTYGLKRAAMAADNYFYRFAEKAAYLPNEMGYEYFRPQISAENLAQIQKNPELYAIIDIAVK